MSELRNYRVYEVWDRFLSAGLLDLIQSFLAGVVVLQTAKNLQKLEKDTNSKTFNDFLQDDDYVNSINNEMSRIQLRVFVMIGLVAMDVFFMTFIQMVSFIITQKKMKCRRSPCMKGKPRFVLDMVGNEQADELLAHTPKIQVHNVCMKYMFILDFGLWIGATTLAIEFKRPSDQLYSLLMNIGDKIGSMDQDMFDLYLGMRDTVNESQQMFFEIALIYGLMIGSLALFASWEIIDAVLSGRFTKCLVHTLCCCCCIMVSNENSENEFLEELHALEKLGSSFDKKIAK